jgi:tetratricopeptide (TPR) repeat protein
MHAPRRAASRLLTAVLVALLAVAGVAAEARTEGGSLERLRRTLTEAERARDGGDLERAADLYRRARDEASGLGKVNLPLARALDGLADVHRLSGRPAESAPLYLRAAAMWESLLGEGQPRLAVTLHNLGLVYLAEGRSDLATPRLRRALEIWESTLGADSPQARNTSRALREAARGTEDTAPLDPRAAGRP